MMNVLALGLVLTSLIAAGFFTPSPEKKEDVIVKEGHRVVVVEYEKDDGNTKVSISPHDFQASGKVYAKGVVTDAMDKLSEKTEYAKEKIKEASSSVPPEVEKVRDSVVGEQQVHPRFSVREVACDAYGKCKHKIENAMGRTKEAVSEKAAEAADKVYEVEEEAKEAVGEAVGKFKESVTHTAHKASDKAHEAKESVKDIAGGVSSSAKDEVAGKASYMKEGAKKVKEEVQREASEKMEGAKDKVSEKAKEAAEMVKTTSDKAKEGADRVKKEGQKELSDILRRAWGVAADAFGYVLSPERMAPAADVFHLMGFAAAYGMCVWVTFVSSYVLAGALPRQQFAMVQSKIYPVYFKAMAYSVGAALLGLLASRGMRIGMFPGFNLLASLVMILVNLLFLEPLAAKVMLERMKKEKEEGRGKEGHTAEATAEGADGGGSLTTAEIAGRGGMTKTTQEKPGEAAAAKSQTMRLTEDLQRLNSYSSLLNVLTLMALTWHLVHLGQRLHTACY